MITADQLVAHAIGDYILQSDWMANEKTKRSIAAFAHAVCYSIPFLLFRPSWAVLVFIVGTHFVIDRWRLARYVCWLKNHLAPRQTSSVQPVMIAAGERTDYLLVTQPWWYSWADCAGTGYHKDRPVWMSVWLLIIADNIMHVLLNGFALRYL